MHAGLVLTLTVLATWFSATPVVARDDDTPKSIAASDWSSIRAAYESNRHAAAAVEGGGYQARNPARTGR